MTTPVQEIKEKLNIVDIVGEYVQLKKNGANHKGLCPFHNEKSPSFTVSEQKQFYHCFGCGKGGDMFQFIQDAESVEFPEALRLLASKAGVTLRAVDPKEQNERSRLMDVLEGATQFFYDQMVDSPAADIARKYMASRGITPETIATFRIGYAPESWDALLRHLTAQGFTQEEIETAGLLVGGNKEGADAAQNKKRYDRFRNRVMFPIEDIHGTVVGFTGRVLEASVKEAKYVNTPQTPLYNKSAVLYGLAKAKPFIQKMNAVVLAEGQMDVVSCHQEKIRNIVASSGTALTLAQVQLIKRYTNNILLAFDGDAAGVAAAWKGMQIAVGLEMNIKVMEMPVGKDPADLAIGQPEVFRELASKALPFMEYIFHRVLSTLDLSQVNDKKKAAAELLPMIALFPDPIEQRHYVHELAQLLGVEDMVLQEKIRQFNQDKTRAANKPSRAAVQAQNRPQQSQQARPQFGQDHTQDGAPFPSEFSGGDEQQGQYPVPEALTAIPEHPSFDEQQIDQALALITRTELNARLAEEICGPEIPIESRATQEQRELYKKLLLQYNHPDTTTDQSSHSIQQSGILENTISMIGEEYYAEFSPDMQEKELRMLLVSLKRSSVQRSLRLLEDRIRQAEKLNDIEKLNEYSQQLSELTIQLKNLP